MRKFILIAFLILPFPLSAIVEDSILPSMETIYTQDFGNKINHRQKKLMEQALFQKEHKLRLMTYNMLYNVKEAEEKLPMKHRWENRKSRLLAYLAYANADIIGSQELQEDQLHEVLLELKDTYDAYGEKTRSNEGRSDTNAIFYNKNRLELLFAKTIPYQDPQYQNAFTYCSFKDRFTNKIFSVINTKFSWASPDRRLAEATQLHMFVTLLPSNHPIIVLGDFNLYPFILHKHNIFFDGDDVAQVLAGDTLQDARMISTFGHFGPLCSITNSRENLQPFVGAQLPGFILDRIFINDQVKILTHGIDTAKVEGEFPSDHFPVIADVGF